MSLNKTKTSEILHGDAVACLNSLDDNSLMSSKKLLSVNLL